jgi:hypothetical protein
MRKLMLIITAFICGCSSFKHPDMDKSKAVVETLIQKENSGDYAATTQYYTDDFNKSEPLDVRTTKFQQLHDALGDYISAACVKAVDSTDLNDFPSVYLEYKVKHSKLTSDERFMVIREEGSLKVELHNIMQGM